MAGASIKIGASSSEFQKQMKEVTNQLKLVSSECSVATEKARLFGNTQDKLSAIQKELTSKLQAQNQIVKIYKDRITGINGEIEKQKAKQAELNKKIEDATKKYKDSVEATGKNSEESKKLNAELQNLKEEYAKNEKAIESNNNKLITATTKMNNTEKAILQNQSALEEINKQISNLNLEKLEKGFDKVSQVSGKASDALKPLSTAIVGLGVASATASIEFEDSMAKVMTIADQSVVSYDDMKRSILELSNQTGISASEIANNVYDAISAGQSTADAVNFVSNSTKLAEAGFAEAGQSLDLLTTIMNSYGLEADEVNKVSDTLIQTQNLGKVTVGQLSADMGKLIPTAKSTGVNLEQVATGYALMTSKGIKSAESTTYMNSMLNELGKSGTKASETVKELTGQSFQELISSGKSVGDILAIMSDGANKNGKSLADMFGSGEAAKAAMILATDSGNVFNETLTKMSESAGSTDKAFNTVNETTGNKLKQSLNEVKNSAINMGDTLAPITSSIAEGFSKLTSILSNLNTEQLTTIAGIGAGIITINLVLGAVSKLTGGIRDGINAYKDFKEFGRNAVEVVKDFGSKAIDGAKAAGQFALNLGKSAVAFAKNAVQAGVAAAKLVAHKVATIASSIATNAMAAAQAALNFVMALNPITLIIIGITALIAAIVLLWNKCEWFRNLCLGLFEAIKAGWNISIAFLKNVWDGFVKGVKSIWNSTINNIKTAWNGWKIIFEVVVSAIKSIWQSTVNNILTIWNGIVSGIKTAWNGFKALFESVGSAISSIWKGIGSGVSSVWDGIVSRIKLAWQGIISPFRSVVNSIGNMWQGIKSMFKLPHFTISGTLNPLKWVSDGMPKIGVDWYYKGGIFKTPTVLGNIGVGDAFNGQGSKAEAVVPLDEMYSKIRNILREEGEQATTFIVKNYIDSKEISEITYKKINGQLAMAAKRGR